jgi:putative transposase
MEREATLLSWVYGAKFHALVLMPNHFHAIVSAPEFDLGHLMRVFMSAVAREVNYKSNQTGHIFGGPYFRSIILSTRYFGHVLKYVYRNPVRAKLSTHIESYPYSTAAGVVGAGRLGVPLHYSIVGFETAIPDPTQPVQWLEWLNQPFPAEAEKLIQKTLRKKEIKSILCRVTRRPEPLLEELI